MRNGRIIQPLGQLLWELDFVRRVPFGNEPRYADASLIELIGDQLLTGLHLSLIEPSEQSARADMHSVVHRNLRHYAPGRMLYFLHTRLNDEGAGQHHGAGQRDQRGPTAPDNGTDKEDPQCGFQFEFVSADDVFDEFTGQIAPRRRTRQQPSEMSPHCPQVGLNAGQEPLFV